MKKVVAGVLFAAVLLAAVGSLAPAETGAAVKKAPAAPARAKSGLVIELTHDLKLSEEE